jgi:hypothetical protein
LIKHGQLLVPVAGDGSFFWWPQVSPCRHSTGRSWGMF